MLLIRVSSSLAVFLNRKNIVSFIINSGLLLGVIFIVLFAIGVLFTVYAIAAFIILLLLVVNSIYTLEDKFSHTEDE